MALTQMQLIQSLGDAMAWLERELRWGVPATELKHLCGRIGELYVAMLTNGQMAGQVNQKGYDVVSATGERISVKTTAMLGGAGHVSFNSNTLNQVDRVVVLRVNTVDMQVEKLLDAPVQEAIALMVGDPAGKRNISLSRLMTKEPKPQSEIETAREVKYQAYVIRELESGTIEVELDGKLQSPTIRALNDLAQQFGVAVVNNNGNPLNTRQLGSQIMDSIQELTAGNSPSSLAKRKLAMEQG